MAAALRAEHGLALSILRGNRPGNSSTPAGSVPGEIKQCMCCGRQRHTCSWQYRAGLCQNTEATEVVSAEEAVAKNGKGKRQYVSLTTGSSCYACVHAARLLKTSRSMAALERAGLLPLVLQVSQAVQRKISNNDSCRCHLCRDGCEASTASVA